MSDTEKPDPAAPAPQEQTPAAPAPEPEKSARMELRREKQQVRTQEKQGKVPSLQQEVTYGFGRKIDEFDAEMEAQLQEAMAGVKEADLLGGGEPKGRGKPAGTEGPKKGKVFRIHGQDVFIDLPGGRSQGVLPILQFPEGKPEVGQEVEVTIEGFDRANGLLLLSRRGAAVSDANWSSIAEGMVVEARVTEAKDAGLIVDVNGIRGFMPISQIDLYRVESANQFVNQRLRCVVTEADPEERNLIVSRRALLEKEREEIKGKTWAELGEGQVREGIVRSVKDFGAFVDVGGVDGLVHVSEMTWERGKDASKLVQVGQKVRVVVQKIDRERQKVSLSMKQLEPSPWDEVGKEKYVPGSIVTGKVTRVAQFGAFVELEPAIEGLVHISELAPQRVYRVTDVVKEGQEVSVKVLDVDREQRRISLSLKAVTAAQAEAAAQAAEQAEAEAAANEPEAPRKPPKPRTTPLRGGTGSSWKLPENLGGGGTK